MREVTLQDRDGIRLSVSRRPDDGALVLRREVHREGAWGPEHRVCSFVVAAADVPRIVTALGAPVEGMDPLDVILAHEGDVLAAGEQAWLRSMGIEPEVVEAPVPVPEELPAGT